MSASAPNPDTPRVTIDPVVFPVAGISVVAVLAWSLLDRERASAFFGANQDWITEHLGWFFTLGIAVFLIVPIALSFGRTGRLRLAPSEDDRPDYGRLTWFSMLFSAGMGIGLLFYGVAEPIIHYAAPPDGGASDGRAAAEAMRVTFFHWGIHAWGVYALTALSLGFFHYRRGEPLAMRSMLRPVLGRFTHRWPGKLVDVLAVFGTLFGLATSLGLGAMQINAGLDRLFGIPIGLPTQVILIITITLAAMVSLLTGLDHGIRRLSELNISLAAMLWAFVLIFGPTAYILTELPAHFVGYVANIPALTVGWLSYGPTDWQKGWTLFYWAWWISWAPFVGIFVARISRGRTVREFVAGVLGVPTLATLVWFGVLGGAAFESELEGIGGIASAVEANFATAIYVLLEQLPGTPISSAIAAAVVALFFVTSSDSGSYVVDTLASGGHPDPPVWQRVFWASAEGAVAAVLLAVGGLGALQSAAIATGLPFAAVLLVSSGCLVYAIRAEPSQGRAANADAPPSS
jgi:choline/glycine/proline betaine transport protein